MKIIDKIFKFSGGIRAETYKDISTKNPIKSLLIPKKLILPLRQHVGKISKLKIKVGDRVLKGQLIAEADGNVSAAVHAPTSGLITSMEKELIPHPSGLPDFCLTLVPDGKDIWMDRKVIDYKKIGFNETIKKLRNSGIVGLGGAAFPSHLKLTSYQKNQVHTLIINAAECEPYITCDDMLMRERGLDLIKGILLVQELLGAKKSIIGIEDNKPEAIKVLRGLVIDSNIQIKVVPTIYPSGDAKRLIYLINGIQIPKDKRSSEFGIQMFNVATLVSIHRYINFGEPSISRIVTITGNVHKPQNYDVLFGTPLEYLIKDTGGQIVNNDTYIMGGPMMGFKLPSKKVPVTKAMNCVISAEPEMLAEKKEVLPCIRCARCADACPVMLQPQELYWFAKSKQLESAEEYKLFDCIECGCCSYVCPSNIPLVQFYRYAKSEIIENVRNSEEANIARERNEFRIKRLEREKQERAERNAQRRAQNTPEEKSKLIDEKRKEISDALNRVSNTKEKI